ncbi:MAG: metal ABC transporter permease [Deltaproteobacteria bacterium]|jgi:zinc transport system permease protein|nr:metal ABC transporter permease [Deltaproteobacteria bacterium]
MLEALSYPFFQRALVAALLASVACGVVGTYVVVKRIASFSGGLAHAAFGGVGLGYLAGFNPLIGATGFALASGVGIGVAHRRLRGGLDSLVAMFWSVGMALGILFTSLAPGYVPDLMSYLFGSILFVSPSYLWFVAGLDVVIMVAVALLFKEFQAVAFDEEFAEVLGVRVGLVLQLLLALIALAVVTLIQVVGVILVIALVTFPAAVARQWAPGLGSMMALATALSAFCSVIGLFAAYGLSTAFGVQLPTGPLIILLAATLYGASSVLVRLRGRGA